MTPKNSNKGFTLIELVIVIAIIAVLGTAVFLNIKPGDILANSRNSTRKSDAQNLSTAINKALVGGDIALTTTNNTFKSSNDANVSYVVTGGGYVPFTQAVANGTAKLDLNKLPSDPSNGNAITTIPTGGSFGGGANKFGVYYCSDGKDFEVDVYLENDTKSEMKTDGGNNDNAYEVGSNTQLCN
jgi:prepilin-type N-terminal cleavage/methylation domain-containing protein